MTEAELTALERVIARADVALQMPDPAWELIRLNTEFHDTINRSARSGWLLGVYSSYRNLILREHWVAAYRVLDPHDSFEGHGEILAALRARDGEAVRHLIEQHVTSGAWVRELWAMTRGPVRDAARRY
jgi:DNA-binding GntR family transcriptional regulator